MPARCQVAECNNFPDKIKGISLHPIPFCDYKRHEAKRRRKKWVDWVKLKRAKWTPRQHSCICSAHFSPESFERKFFIPGNKRTLICDSFGIVAFPTIYKAKETETEQVSRREQRKVGQNLVLFIFLHGGHKPRQCAFFHNSFIHSNHQNGICESSFFLSQHPYIYHLTEWNSAGIIHFLLNLDCQRIVGLTSGFNCKVNTRRGDSQ